ncbi:MAG: helix-turn-helix domain-containing protein [Nitrospinaceae bacterium]
MSILAKNLRTIRKELLCTQSMMADILKVGFRTYVRYEAGERDAPVSVLVKIAKLGNLSLEHLLTKEVNKNFIAPLKAFSKNPVPPDVRIVNFRAGHVLFKKPSRQELLTLDDAERKLVSLYRKMDAGLQKKCLDNLGKALKDGRNRSKGTHKVKKKTVKKSPTSTRPKTQVKTRKTASPKAGKKGKPGRKKLDRKLLKEKIDKLKIITGSVNKITVR